MRPSSLGTGQLLFLGLLSFPGRSPAQATPAVPHGVFADSCLAPAEFQLGGVELHSDALAAISTLKPPVRKATRTGEDDGGRYEIQTYDTPALSVQVGRGMIEKLATRSRATSTPSGIRPGMAFDTVRDILKTQGVTLKQFADTVGIAVCSTTEGIVLEEVLTLMFDRQRRLRVIALTVPGP